MKSFKGVKMGIQGDVALTRVDSLPENMEAAVAENGAFVIAHSETGHNHVVAEREAKFYNDPNDALVGYVVVAENEKAQLTHQRSYDTHETVEFDTGVYRINRQREYTPEGFRRVAD